MGRINKLDREVCRNLTTGQVCVDLSGIVKELIDNSLDAGATRISIKLYNDGIEKVQVEDNGSGIEKEDFGMIAELHATSKIKSYEDFTGVQTYGFRGEALNSLCSSSKLTVLTKVEGGKGYHLEFDNTGKYLPEKTKDVVMNVGTTVIVTDFMCHYPVRRKEYETKAAKEVQKIVRMLQNYAFSKVDLAFELLNIVGNKTTVLMRSPGGNTKIESAISSIFSDKARFLRDTVRLEDVDISDEAYELYRLDKTRLDFRKIDQVKFEGCISGMKNVVKSSVDYIFLSVNKRPINNPDIKKAVKNAYLKSNPTFGIIFVLQLTLPSNYFDVNCSPLKDLMECTIMNLILAKVYSCVDATLMKENPPDTCEMKRKNIEDSPGLASQGSTQVPIDNFINKVIKLSSQDEEDENAEEGLNNSNSSDGSVSTYDAFVSKRKTVYGLFNSTMLSQVNDKTIIPNTLSIDDDMDEIDENLEPNINDTTDIVEETTDFVEKTADSNHGKSTSPEESSNMNDETTIQPEEMTNVNDEATGLIPETDMSSTTFSDDVFKRPKEIPSEIVDLSNRPQVTVKFSLKALQERVKVISQQQQQIPPVKKEDIHVVFGEETGQEAEETLKRRINKKDFARMHIIGQFNNGFIICSLENDVFIVDQHASDEIYNFERLQRVKTVSPHLLLKPIQIKLGAVYEAAIRDNLSIFEKNGFRFKFINTDGENESIELTYIPCLEGYKFEVSDVEEMAVYLAENPGSNYRPEKIRKVFASKACRGSVMVGDPLSVNKMKSILENLSKLDAPWNCPHGRPTIRQLYYEK